MEAEGRTLPADCLLLLISVVKAFTGGLAAAGLGPPSARVGTDLMSPRHPGKTSTRCVAEERPTTLSPSGCVTCTVGWFAPPMLNVTEALGASTFTTGEKVRPAFT